MVGKNKKIIESEDEDETQDCATELDLPLEKLNLGPGKKLLVMNLNGLLFHRIHRSEKSGIRRSADGRYRGYLGM